MANKSVYFLFAFIVHYIPFLSSFILYLSLIHFVLLGAVVVCAYHLHCEIRCFIVDYFLLPFLLTPKGTSPLLKNTTPTHARSLLVEK